MLAPENKESANHGSMCSIGVTDTESLAEFPSSPSPGRAPSCPIPRFARGRIAWPWAGQSQAGAYLPAGPLLSHHSGAGLLALPKWCHSHRLAHCSAPPHAPGELRDGGVFPTSTDPLSAPIHGIPAVDGRVAAGQVAAPGQEPPERAGRHQGVNPGKFAHSQQ